MAIPLLQIPGNIKQQFAPFVIDPKAKLHKFVKSSIELERGVSPQFFSYRKNNVDYSSGKALLRFYPSSLDTIQINDDISYKLLYGRDQKGEPTQNSLTIQDVLNCIPGVSIREFLPDTRLDQCINMFTSLITEMTKLFSDAENKPGESKQSTQSTDTKTDNPWYKKLSAAAWYTMRYMVGMTNPNFFNDLKFDENTFPFTNYNTEVVDSFGFGDKSPGFYVMKFPYALYYRLQSCVTTNVYEVPAQSDNKAIYSSSGSAGWTSGGDIMSVGGFRISGLLNKIPVIGGIANMILGNIGINYMPWWNAEAGSNTKEPEVNIKFDLFNDNAKSAMDNFIFVNTIVPNNRWIQYNMFQHSSNLYDVKIEGLNRLFACAGDFNVTYEGVLRDPPASWIRTLAYSHLNQNMDKDNFLNNAIVNKIIKIPDVYHVELKFQSLLPANFNNFIFMYAQNTNHMSIYQDKAYDKSVLTEALPNAIASYAKRIKNVWNAGDSAVEDLGEKIDENKKLRERKWQMLKDSALHRKKLRLNRSNNNSNSNSNSNSNHLRGMTCQILKINIDVRFI